MAPVSRIFHRDLVLNASHGKGESVLFGQCGYKDEIYCFNVHFKHAGNFFAFLCFSLKTRQKKIIVSGNPFCHVTVIHCMLLLSCYSTGKVNANKRDYKATCIFN